MHTEFAPRYATLPEAERARGILRSCVHCGFCAAACPTYQLTGDELDGPRGRIYLIKQLLEGGSVSAQTQLHLDRCLTCGACETACPSGVRYRSLLEIGRELVDQEVARGRRDRWLRWFMLRVVCDAGRFALAARLGRLLRWGLPAGLRAVLPGKPLQPLLPPQRQHARRMLVLRGCVQPTATPRTNTAAARVLDRLGITLMEVPEAGCCGAISHHLTAPEHARELARRNIDAWWPQVEAGAEAIVMTASGCGLMVKEYRELLRTDADYAAKAERISALALDLCEVLAREPLQACAGIGQGRRIAFQSPCTLRHGHGLGGVIEDILRRCGYALTDIPADMACCGAAGPYMLLQRELSEQLREQALAMLQQWQPTVIASANVGCQMHLAQRAQVPVIHWIELLDR